MAMMMTMLVSLLLFLLIIFYKTKVFLIYQRKVLIFVAAQRELLNAAQLPFPGSTNKCDSELADCLIRIIENCSLTGIFFEISFV